MTAEGITTSLLRRSKPGLQSCTRVCPRTNGSMSFSVEYSCCLRAGWFCCQWVWQWVEPNYCANSDSISIPSESAARGETNTRYSVSTSKKLPSSCRLQAQLLDGLWPTGARPRPPGHARLHAASPAISTTQTTTSPLFPPCSSRALLRL